jgi:phage/plasmid-like protein (TIGR03299 family)
MIDFSKGFAAIALAEHRGAAWHGHGAYVGDAADMAEWQRKAGADWNVVERSLFYAGQPTAEGKGKPVKVDDRKALLRDDTFGYLSTVGDGYEVVQPRELFDFQRKVIAEFGAKMDTAGVLDGGRRLWTLSRIDRELRIKGQDLVNFFLLAATSLDSTMSSRFAFVGTRVVCQNTLSIALGDTRNGYVAVPHSTKVDIGAVVAKLRGASDDVDTFAADVTALAEVTPTPEQLAEFFKRVLDNPFRTDDKGALVISDPAKKVFALLQRGQGADLKSARGTAWGAVNAVTEYVDHYQRSKDAGTRLNSAWFGAGADRKATALEVAKEVFLAAA